MEKLLLKGSSNEHILVGDFKEENLEIIIKSAKIIHKDSQGEFAQHGTIIIPPATYRVSNLVEYNPFTRTISGIWD